MSVTATQTARIMLPRRARPSKALAEDVTHATIVEHGSGRVLVTTDSYCLVAIPVPDSIPLGPISAAALRLIEEGRDHEFKDGEVIVRHGFEIRFPQPDVKHISKVPDIKHEDADQVVTVALNPTLLKAIAKGLGVRGRPGLGAGVRLTIAVKDGTTLRGMRVEPLDGNGEFGLLMPIRTNA